MLRRALASIMTAAALAACASGGKGSSASPATASAPSYRANVITAEEISAHQLASALDAVLELRPQWDRVPVYMNGRRWGAFEKLQEIPAGTVKEIHLYSREEARVRFGQDTQESILVVLK